ncbi:uncharacterized protein LOC105850205 [Hydra vulgaris]|uniref:Uncharacterized protein LOC105850205 n=1 Tax=Hydra vulgaris TaxID=6087 RepID=A0ABM4C1A8_HYDVU
MTSKRIDSPQNDDVKLDSNSTENIQKCDFDKWYYIDKEMIPAKLTYFFTGLERSSASPYFIMFYTSIGLNLKQAGYVFSFSYAGLMVGSIFWGVLADKTRAYRILLFTLYILYGVFALLIPFVSSKIGEKEKNQCPSINKFSNNSTNKTIVDDYSPVSTTTLTYVMATLGFFTSSFSGSIYSYVDAGVIEKIKMSTKRKDFGRQYMFVNIGFAFGALISGEMMDIFPKVKISCYFAVFSVGVIFLIASCICSQYLYKGIIIPSRKEVKSDSFKKDLIQTLTNFEVILFLITTFANGFLYCIYLNYFFLFLKELKATNLLIGLTVGFGSTSGIFVNFFNEKIIKLLRGTFNTIIMCTFLWSVRFFIFYFLINPWLIIPLQLTLHGLCLSLFFSVKSVHLKLISPNSIHSTMFGIIQCLHSGISPIVGSLIGGELYFTFGARNTFLYVCLIALGWTVILCMYIFVKYRTEKNARKLSKSAILNEYPFEDSEYITKF